MAIKNWFNKRCVAGVLGMGALGVCCFPLTPIFGSWAGFFSVKAMVLPLVGAFSGVGGALFLAGFRLLIRSMWGAALDAHILAHYLPGLCASFSWATQSILVHLVLPLACMLLFVMHPEGAQAWYYSLYWLIPVVIYCSKIILVTNFSSWRAEAAEKPGRSQPRAIFFAALSSTFIAHAVGSVIWLYTMPTSASLWQALLPVVAVERLVFATGMSVGYCVIAAVLRRIPVSRPMIAEYLGFLGISVVEK
jgi:hypothetical protein